MYYYYIITSLHATIRAKSHKDLGTCSYRWKQTKITAQVDALQGSTDIVLFHMDSIYVPALAFLLLYLW